MDNAIALALESFIVDAPKPRRRPRRVSPPETVSGGPLHVERQPPRTSSSSSARANRLGSAEGGEGGTLEMRNRSRSRSMNGLEADMPQSSSSRALINPSKQRGRSPQPKPQAVPQYNAAPSLSPSPPPPPLRMLPPPDNVLHVQFVGSSGQGCRSVICGNSGTNRDKGMGSNEKHLWTIPRGSDVTVVLHATQKPSMQIVHHRDQDREQHVYGDVLVTLHVLPPTSSSQDASPSSSAGSRNAAVAFKAITVSCSNHPRQGFVRVVRMQRLSATIVEGMADQYIRLSIPGTLMSDYVKIDAVSEDAMTMTRISLLALSCAPTSTVRDVLRPAPHRQEDDMEEDDTAEGDDVQSEDRVSFATQPPPPPQRQDIPAMAVAAAPVRTSNNVKEFPQPRVLNLRSSTAAAPPAMTAATDNEEEEEEQQRRELPTRPMPSSRHTAPQTNADVPQQTTAVYEEVGDDANTSGGRNPAPVAAPPPALPPPPPPRISEEKRRALRDIIAQHTRQRVLQDSAHLNASLQYDSNTSRTRNDISSVQQPTEGASKTLSSALASGAHTREGSSKPKTTENASRQSIVPVAQLLHMCASLKTPLTSANCGEELPVCVCLVPMSSSWRSLLRLTHLTMFHAVVVFPLDPVGVEQDGAVTTSVAACSHQPILGIDVMEDSTLMQTSKGLELYRPRDAQYPGVIFCTECSSLTTLFQLSAVVNSGVSGLRIRAVFDDAMGIQLALDHLQHHNSHLVRRLNLIVWLESLVQQMPSSSEERNSSSVVESGEEKKKAVSHGRPPLSVLLYARKGSYVNRSSSVLITPTTDVMQLSHRWGKLCVHGLPTVQLHGGDGGRAQPSMITRCMLRSAVPRYLAWEPASNRRTSGGTRIVFTPQNPCEFFGVAQCFVGGAALQASVVPFGPQRSRRQHAHHHHHQNGNDDGSSFFLLCEASSSDNQVLLALSHGRRYEASVVVCHIDSTSSFVQQQHSRQDAQDSTLPSAVLDSWMDHVALWQDPYPSLIIVTHTQEHLLAIEDEARFVELDTLV